MGYPLAYFLSWTCYASWLHGDERGSVDRDHNAFGTPWLPPDPGREKREYERSRGPAVRLDGARRDIVRRTIEDHCRIRSWSIHALNVRTNHVHVVVSCAVAPERAMDQFKAWCTRRLREAGLADKDARIWTEHGSTRYLWDEVSLAGAVKYVVEGQGPDLA